MSNWFIEEGDPPRVREPHAYPAGWKVDTGVVATTAAPPSDHRIRRDGLVRVISCHLVEKRRPVIQWESTRYTRRYDVTEKVEETEGKGGPMSEDPVFEITDPDEPCACGCGMAEGDR